MFFIIIISVFGVSNLVFINVYFYETLNIGYDKANTLGGTIMNKLERREDSIKGAVAGMVGAVVKYGFNELTQFLQIAKYDNNTTAITVVFTQYERSLHFWTIGFIHALLIGALFGVIIAFIFDYILTEKNYLLKAAGIGIFIYFFNFGIMSKVFNYPADIATLPGDIIAMFFSLIIYAVVTAYTLKRLGFFRPL
jgi:hypothetical protein